MEISPQNTKNRENYPAKRNRDLVSCTECHRRKRKCSRSLPCDECLVRGVPQKCAFKPQVSTQQLPRTSASSNGRWKRINNGTELVLSAESIADLIVGGSTDPFNSLPGGLDDEPRLVHHYNSVFLKTRHAPGARELWFPMAVKDPAFFHSILMISTANITGLQKKPPAPSFWYHRGQAIKHINTRLVHVDSANTDLSIATIACLCLVDCLGLVEKSVRAHQMALQKLVVTRGGLEKLGKSIQKLLGWVDLTISLALEEPPVMQKDRLSAVHRSTYYEAPSFSTVLYATDLKTRLCSFTNQPKLSNDLARIYWGLRNITVLTNTASSVDSWSSTYFSDRCEFLEREVQELLHNSLRVSIHGSKNQSLIFTLFARVSLIYIYSDLRELLATAKLFQELSEKIAESLDIGDQELNILLDLFPDLMLWALSIARNAAVLSRKVYYVKIAAKILMPTGINGIKKSADAFLWPEGRENHRSRSLYDTNHAAFPFPDPHMSDSPTGETQAIYQVT